MKQKLGFMSMLTNKVFIYLNLLLCYCMLFWFLGVNDLKTTERQWSSNVSTVFKSFTYFNKIT